MFGLFRKTDLEVPEQFRMEKQFNRSFYLTKTRQEFCDSKNIKLQTIFRQTELLRVYCKNNYTLTLARFVFHFPKKSKIPLKNQCSKILNTNKTTCGFGCGTVENIIPRAQLFFWSNNWHFSISWNKFCDWSGSFGSFLLNGKVRTQSETWKKWIFEVSINP